MRPKRERLPYQRLYDRAQWRRRRLLHLAQNPLCVICKSKGHIVAAVVAHHIKPHKGDTAAFFMGALQSLCKACHDGICQKVEKAGFDKTIDESGWPVDQNHPVYRQRKP
jgi:5-methylcytosine-specific restriction enzyme A